MCLHVLCLTKKFYMYIIIYGASFSTVEVYIHIYSDFLWDVCSLRYADMYVYTIGLIIKL